MQKLISYTANNDQNLSLIGDLQIQGPELLLEFSLGDPSELVDVPKITANWEPSQIARQDGLWQATCFEAFLQPVGLKKYYEFNFSLAPAWNAYVFSSYREPQAPQPTTDFELISINWNASEKKLRIKVKNHSSHHKFQVGLTTILLEKTGAKHFYALAHKGSKPDFHISESFILQRGS